MMAGCDDRDMKKSEEEKTAEADAVVTLISKSTKECPRERSQCFLSKREEWQQRKCEFSTKGKAEMLPNNHLLS